MSCEAFTFNQRGIYSTDNLRKWGMTDMYGSASGSGALKSPLFSNLCVGASATECKVSYYGATPFIVGGKVRLDNLGTYRSDGRPTNPVKLMPSITAWKCAAPKKK